MLHEYRLALSASTELGRMKGMDELDSTDEVGYVPLAEIGAAALFQVMAERAEQAADLPKETLTLKERFFGAGALSPDLINVSL